MDYVLKHLSNNDNEIETAEELVALIETSLRERFTTEQIPEFVMNISEIAAAEISAAENILNNGVVRLLDKVKAMESNFVDYKEQIYRCLLYTSPSPRDPKTSRMPSSA